MCDTMVVMERELKHWQNRLVQVVSNYESILASLALTIEGLKEENLELKSKLERESTDV